MVLASGNGGLVWSRIPTPDNIGFVNYLDNVNGHWLLAGNLNGVVSIYEAADIAKPDWRKLDVGNIPQSMTPVSILREGSRRSLFFPPETVLTYDSTTNQWATSKTPFEFDRIIGVGEGCLVADLAFGTQRSVFKNMSIYTSADNGKNWAKSKAPRLAGKPAYKSKNLGFAFDIDMGAMSSDTILLKTVDGGENWSRLGKAPIFANAAFYDTLHDEIVVFSGSQIQVYNVGTAKWGARLR